KSAGFIFENWCTRDGVTVSAIGNLPSKSVTVRCQATKAGTRKRQAESRFGLVSAFRFPRNVRRKRPVQLGPTRWPWARPRGPSGPGATSPRKCDKLGRVELVRQTLEHMLPRLADVEEARESPVGQPGGLGVG